VTTPELSATTLTSDKTGCQQVCIKLV